MRIVIEGHVDERGSDSYNLALGDNRGRAERDYLIGLWDSVRSNHYY